MEIVEGLCDSGSFECNQMLEEHEELLETWWFKRFVEVDSKCCWKHQLNLSFFFFSLSLSVVAIQENQTS